MKQQKSKQTKDQVVKEDETFTREDFLDFLKKVSRPIPTKKQGGKSNASKKRKTSE